MNRLTVKGWADLRRESEQKDVDAKQLADDLEALQRFREYLLNNSRGEATLILRNAVDDYVGALTGNREFLWSQNFRFVQPNTDN